MGRIVVLASGSGSNFQAICEAFVGSDHAVAGLICNRPGAAVIRRANRLGVPAVTVEYSGTKGASTEQTMIGAIEKWMPDLVVLAGFMRILSPGFVTRFSGMIVNIHPSILPAYPGLHAIERAYANGEHRVGITIHFVDDGVDTGEIIRQESLARGENESLESLEERIHNLEHQVYPQTIAEILKERAPVPDAVER